MMGHSKQIGTINQQKTWELTNAPLSFAWFMEAGRRLIMYLSEGPGLCLFPVFI